MEIAPKLLDKGKPLCYTLYCSLKNKGRRDLKGILFKPDMIKAIVEGRKTMTRRVMQHQPVEMDKVYYKAFRKDFGARKPRYQVGEVVYIKEAWSIRDCGKKVSLDKATWENGFPTDRLEFDIEGYWWNKRSPLFMPEWAARYFIRITDVRAERLNDISSEDCMAEGIGSTIPYQGFRYRFRVLWDSTNKPPYDWQSNPWVWVYTFERTEK